MLIRIFNYNSFITLFQALMVLLLFASCGDKIEREKIIGKYVWNDGRLDTLEIRADGTYEYWASHPGQKIANSGKWKLNSLLNEVEFELENFPFLPDHAEGRSWYSRLRSQKREIHLLNAQDPSLYLKKIGVAGE